jgi:hypothetical protein
MLFSFLIFEKFPAIFIYFNFGKKKNTLYDLNFLKFVKLILRSNKLDNNNSDNEYGLSW